MNEDLTTVLTEIANQLKGRNEMQTTQSEKKDMFQSAILEEIRRLNKNLESFLDSRSSDTPI